MKFSRVKIGDEYVANCGIVCKVVERLNTNTVVIEWQDEFKHRQTARPNRVREGKVYNPYFPSSFGVGYPGFGEYLPVKHKLEHSVWYSMLERCYKQEYKDWKPTYETVTVCGDWLNFQNFATWYNNQKFAGVADYQLDKDILVKGNKIYAPEFCSLVPREINMLLVTRENGRGSLPIGVHWRDKKVNCYAGQYKEFAGDKHSKLFPTIEEAFLFYKENKERVVKEYAEAYKDKVDERVYIALCNYQVEITD